MKRAVGFISWAQGYIFYWRHKSPLAVVLKVPASIQGVKIK
jgi:hypothetical protein